MKIKYLQRRCWGGDDKYAHKSEELRNVSEGTCHSWVFRFLEVPNMICIQFNSHHICFVFLFFRYM